MNKIIIIIIIIIIIKFWLLEYLTVNFLATTSCVTQWHTFTNVIL